MGTGYVFTSFLFVLQAGIYWVNLIDHFCAGWGILFAAVLEIIGIVYIYGKLLTLKNHTSTIDLIIQTEHTLNICFCSKRFMTS